VDKKGIGAEMKQPGRLKWQDVTLKRGITDNMEIWKWRQLIEEGQIEKARSNGSIVMMSQDYKDVARWDFVNAWPSKVSGPSVKADSNEIGVEEVVIVHEGLIRKS
jgi:phage tail-like protein